MTGDTETKAHARRSPEEVRANIERNKTSVLITLTTVLALICVALLLLDWRLPQMALGVVFAWPIVFLCQIVVEILVNGL